MAETRGMTIIVRTVVRLLVGIVLLYGLYLTAHGHLTPGGGFGGGVVLALGLLSVLLAFGRDEAMAWLRIPALSALEATSYALLLAAGLLGLAFGEAFLANVLARGRLFSLASAGLIPILNVLIGVKVGLSLFLAVLALARFDPEKGDEA